MSLTERICCVFDETAPKSIAAGTTVIADWDAVEGVKLLPPQPARSKSEATDKKLTTHQQYIVQEDVVR
jgi:hypothetical protein